MHVDASGRDIRRHQHSILSRLEARQRLGALGLGAVAVDPLGVDSVAVEKLGQTVRPVLGTGEHQRVVDEALPEEFHQQRSPLARRNGVRGVNHPLGRRCFDLKRNLRRLTEDLLGQLLDRARHRGAEEERLFRLGDVAEYAPDVGQEPHVQHPVSLVEDQILQARKSGISVLEVVEQPARGGDDDFGSTPERCDLRAHRHATVYGCRLETGILSQPVQVIPDLERELPGGSQDQRTGRPPWEVHQLV